MLKKNCFNFFIFVLVFFICFFCTFSFAAVYDEGAELYQKGKEQAEKLEITPVLPSQTGIIKSIYTEEKSLNIENYIEKIVQKVEVEVLSGKDKGKTYFIENVIMGNPAYDLFLEKGDKVILHAEESENNINYYIEDLYRLDGIYILCGIFVCLLVIVGRWKGLRSLISILLTLSLIFWGLVPLLLKGLNPILSTVFICVLSCIFSFFLISGINKKSISAILGTVLSLIFSGLLSLLTIKITYLTGFSQEESLFLFTAFPSLDFIGILSSGMLIGALGALMDIAISISSTINEILKNSPEISFKELFKSGMNVGKDIIGTMANTLILAYLGSSFFLILLANEIDLQKFFNLNQVSTEIAAAIVGSIGIVICVPITAIISTFLLKKNFNFKNVENL